MQPEPVTFQIENPTRFYSEIGVFCADINENLLANGIDEVLKIRTEEQLTEDDVALTGRDPLGRLVSLQVLYSVPGDTIKRPGRELGSGAMRAEYLGLGITRFHAKALPYYGMLGASSDIYCVTRTTNSATIETCANHEGMVVIDASDSHIVYLLDRKKLDVYRDMYIAGRDEALRSSYCHNIADELLELESPH